MPVPGNVSFSQHHTAICKAFKDSTGNKAVDGHGREGNYTPSKHQHLPIAMKLRFSWTLRQDTSVGLLPGMAGKIRVHRGFPLSLLSKFQTFT